MREVVESELAESLNKVAEDRRVADEKLSEVRVDQIFIQIFVI